MAIFHHCFVRSGFVKQSISQMHPAGSGHRLRKPDTCPLRTKRDSVINITPTASRLMSTLVTILSMRLNNQLAEEIPFSEALERFRRLGKR